jgi:hypothetical protein
MLVPVALALIALPAAGFPLRMLSGYYLVVTLPVLYWTQSRSGWLGMAGGVGTALLLLAWRKSRTWLLTAVVALPLLGAAGGFAAWHALPAVRERIGQVLENPVKAGGIRMEMWRDAPAMFRAQPWLGHGGGGYAWAYPPFQRNVTQHLHYDYVHNDYIQLALEHGAVGLGLAGLALLVSAWGIGRAVRRSRSDEPAVLLAGAAGALAACLLHALFDFNFHIFPNPHALVWVVGLSWGVWAAMERGVEPPAGREQVLRRAAGAASAAACVLGVWWSLSMGMAYYWNLKADLARSRLEWDRVERDYRRAIRWTGWTGSRIWGWGISRPAGRCGTATRIWRRSRKASGGWRRKPSAITKRRWRGIPARWRRSSARPARSMPPAVRRRPWRTFAARRPTSRAPGSIASSWASSCAAWDATAKRCRCFAGTSRIRWPPRSAP